MAIIYCLQPGAHLSLSSESDDIKQ
ncbi:hypothetical protein CCACVL1_26868 [Corchorus capsularis]|uniref:Uncharacterized protein n=1 Tax=Corchorus capsularis TaxID=210143 RepID=A0A1R3GCY3_COCAP|nr:hypothetical protein CCACVL1_26868 [Corchorus capsularis]